MIKAVVFDFGNVICSFDMKRSITRLSALTGFSPIRLAKAAAHVTQHALEYETGLISSDEFFHRVVTNIDIPISQAEFLDAFIHQFEPIPSTFELIRKVKPRYKVGLLSNTNAWHYEFGIKTIDVFPLFDAVTLSFEVKAMKPAEKIYRDVLAKLKVRPEEAVYIDDVREYAEAATALGMHGIHYTGHASLLRRLNALHMTI